MFAIDPVICHYDSPEVCYSLVDEANLTIATISLIWSFRYWGPRGTFLMGQEDAVLDTMHRWLMNEHKRERGCEATKE